jgi:benzoyl-CoA reductase/2-hydroxyglutaryl-CoA dehydratase subunit BcrC/BadD/HgdB
MKTVIFTCAFVPPEWIAAHGLEPRRISPALDESDTAGPTVGICPFARAFIHSARRALDADAVIVTTVCDQMRRVPEQIARFRDVPVFLMNVPSTWEHESSAILYAEELKRLGRFLVSLGGAAPSPEHLAEVMQTYDERRLRLREAGPGMSPRDYTRALLAGAATETNRPLKVTPLRGDDFDVFDLLAEAGGRVVLDATDSGERTQPGPYEKDRLVSQPLAEMARAYFGSIPHAFQRPNDRLYRYLEREFAARGVRVVVFRRYVWCDTWNAELQRLRRASPVPVLDLDLGQEGHDRGRCLTRLQALLELL